MLTIDRLRLTLPAGFAPRAERIARLLGETLAEEAPRAAADLSLTHLAPPPISVTAGASDRAIARAIAGALGRQLATGRERA